jgi:hypothetical protein
MNRIHASNTITALAPNQGKFPLQAARRRIGLSQGEGEQPLRPELAAPLGVCSSSELAQCAGGRAGSRLSGDVAVLCCCTAFASSAYVPGRRRAAPEGGCWPLGTADPGCTSHQRVWIALLAAAQTCLRPGRRAATRAIPSILNVIMPTQVALPLPPPWNAAHCGCCHLAFRPCHPGASLAGHAKATLCRCCPRIASARDIEPRFQRYGYATRVQPGCGSCADRVKTGSERASDGDVTTEHMTYALRGCSRALLAGSKPALVSCSQAAAGGDRWLLMTVRGHVGDTGP